MSSLLPAGWQQSNLEQVCVSMGGGTPSKSDSTYWVNGSIPWVSPKDMKSFEIGSSEDMVTEKALEKLSMVPAESVLVVVRSGILSRTFPVAVAKVPVTVNQDMRAFVPQGGIEAKYLAWQLVAKELEILSRCSKDGTTVASVESGALAAFELNIAPLREQERIVAKLEEVFSDLDEGVAELKSAQKKLTLYRQSLLKAAVEGDLTAGWRRQRAGLATGDDLLSRILARRRDAWETVQLERFEAEGRKPPKDWQKKYAEPVRPDGGGLPDVPPEWAWAKVNQTGLVQLGRQRAPQFHTGPNMLPYLRVANVFENRIDVSDVMQMHFSDADEDAYKLAAGDILLNEGQSLELVGRPAIYRGELPKACFTNTLVRYSVEEGVLPEFALAVFLHYMHSGRFRRIATITTNIAHLGAGRFAELEFPLPGTEEQEEIVRRLAEQMESVERQRAAISKALKQAAAQRQNILRAAFSGQLVAQDPGDEPAGVLLERIRAERAAGQPARTRGRKPRVVKDAA